MKILNLYSGIGGNRKNWGDDHDITAIENNPEIAKIYQDFFPNDKMIVTDAHQYLLEHFKEYDFIWSSPPCPSHSSIRFLMVGKKQHGAIYPDIKLYEEILFLKYYFKGKWVVENVKPYYDPLIKPSVIIDRHLFWCNFYIKKCDSKKEKNIRYVNASDSRYGFNLKEVKINHRKDQIIRNLVNPEIGLHILNRALEITEADKYGQSKLFES